MTVLTLLNFNKLQSAVPKLYTVKKVGWISLRGTELIEGPSTHVVNLPISVKLPCQGEFTMCIN